MLKKRKFMMNMALKKTSNKDIPTSSKKNILMPMIYSTCSLGLVQQILNSDNRCIGDNNNRETIKVREGGNNK